MTKTVQVISIVLTLSIALAGCGVKSQPERPGGSTYPRDYPVMPSKKKPQASLLPSANHS